MQRVYILEDEIDLQENIELLLTRSGYEVAGKDIKGETLIQLIDIFPTIDIFIIDIMLEGNISGIEVAKKIREQSKAPIIFLTALSDMTTLELISTIDQSSYLLKPFNKDSFLTTVKLSLLKSRDFTNKNLIKIRDKGHQINLDENEILLLKADGLYTKIYTETKQFMVREILKEVVEKLSKEKFLRIHKSFIVNMDKVTSFNSKEVTVADQVLPLRRGFYRKFQKLLDERLQKK